MKIIKISNIKKIDYNGPVYDLTVEQAHSYNINGVIVHNSVCSTSVQCGIHASHQWMIEGIKKLECYWHYPVRTKIIADGGINTLDKAIKALAIGYDYVMMGKQFAQCIEACGETRKNTEVVFDFKTKQFSPQIERKYYGMASEQGQIDISGGVNKNPEGIETWVPVDTNLHDLTIRFEAALRSTMSYTGAHNLEEFRNTKYDIQSNEEFKSYYK